MNGELHDVSEAIGELRTEVRLANEQRGETNRRLAEIAARLEGVAVLKERVDRIEPLVDAHEAARQRGKGMTATIGALGGTGGAGVVGLVGKKLGWW